VISIPTLRDPDHHAARAKSAPEQAGRGLANTTQSALNVEAAIELSVGDGFDEFRISPNTELNNLDVDAFLGKETFLESYVNR